MEKLYQICKIKFLKFLPNQPVASVAFQYPILSPFRSPVSIIPKEARRNKRGGIISFSAKEPSSPKVSCMAQVQPKKKKNKAQEGKRPKLVLWISKGFGKGPKQSERGFVLEEKACARVVNAPSLGPMQKFVSGRGTTLFDFDIAIAER